MLNKKGAVSAFLIVGLVLVIIGGILFFIRSEYITKSLEKQEKAAAVIPAEAQPVQSYVEGCLQQTINDGLILLGQSGGYLDLPAENVLGFPYYFYDNKADVPTMAIINTELNKYIEVALPLCTRNFSALEGYDIEASSDVRADAKITADKASAVITYNVNVKKGAYTTSLSEFSAEVPTTFTAVYSAALDIAKKQAENPDSICLSCINDIVTKNGFYIDMTDYGNDTTIYKITDPKSVTDNIPFEYVFAERFER